MIYGERYKENFTCHTPNEIPGMIGSRGKNCQFI
jgi:hypothetical protein